MALSAWRKANGISRKSAQRKNKMERIRQEQMVQSPGGQVRLLCCIVFLRCGILYCK